MLSDIEADKTYTIKVEATNEYGTTSQSKKSEPGPITADKLQRGKYVWYVDSEGNKRKSIVLYDSLEDGGIEVCCLEPLVELTMGIEGRTKEAYDICRNQALQYEELLNAEPKKLMNSTTSTLGRALFTSREGKTKRSVTKIDRGTEKTEKCVSSADIARMQEYGPENWIEGRRMWLGDWAEYNVGTYDPTHRVEIPYYWRGFYLDTTYLAVYVPKKLNEAASWTTKTNTCSVYGVFRLNDDVIFQDGDGSEQFPYTISLVKNK